MNDHELYSTVVVRQATTPIRLGDELLGGKICAASVGNLVEANIALEAECERLRQQLAACGVVALGNTPESAAQARQMHQDYMSASCSDVADAVDREMTMRQQLADVFKGNTKLHVLWTAAVQQRDALAAELAAIKGQEPVAIANKGNGAFWVTWTDAGKSLRGPGIKLYALPPASHDQEGT